MLLSFLGYTSDTFGYPCINVRIEPHSFLAKSAHRVPASWSDNFEAGIIQESLYISKLSEWNGDGTSRRDGIGM